jgi:hypothetical protein
MRASVKDFIAVALSGIDSNPEAQSNGEAIDCHLEKMVSI